MGALKDLGGLMNEPAMTAEEVARQLRGLQAIERIRDALEDRFEVEVRETVAGGGDYPQDRLHDYLTGVEDGHEPRVRLLFELYERDALDLTGLLADVPQSCFFLGHAVRHQRSLRDWLAILGPECVHIPAPGDLLELELWSAGDLVWGVSRERAQDAADYLTLVLDRPVGLWRARLPARALRWSAIDRWAGRDELRYVVPPHVLDVPGREPGDTGDAAAPAGCGSAQASIRRHVGTVVQINPGDPVPLDVPLTPRPRIVDER